MSREDDYGCGENGRQHRGKLQSPNKKYVMTKNSISEKRLKQKREQITEKMMDVEGVEDDGDAIIKFIATKTERLVFTWPIRY